MTKYVAFLRGINVSGQKVTLKEELIQTFEVLGFQNVKSYIQTGNILFETPGKDKLKIRQEIECSVFKNLGYRTEVMVLGWNELEVLVDRNPFKNMNELDNVKSYATFLYEPVESNKSLPFMSLAFGIEILEINKTVIFSLGLLRDKGRFGFPNIFIEKEFKVKATTRNWSTVLKIMSL